MELTKLTHTLTIGGVSHVIDEPIGFDSLKTKISRGTYHGVSAEVSVSKLEFYNNAGRNAATIIRDAYNSDIDTEITYTVTDDDGDMLYSGVLDLASYSENSANATKIGVNVGEVGIKTTFNNRSETEVDLNRTTTINGESLAHNPSWKNLLVPARSIWYKNKMTEPETTVHSTNYAGKTMQLPDDKQWMFLNIALDKTNLEEFGTFQPNLNCAGLDSLILDGYVDPLFSKGEDFDKKYGASSTYDITVNLTIRIKFNGDVYAHTSSTPYFQFNTGLWKSLIYNGSLIQGTRRYISNDGGRYSEGGGSYNTRDTDDCHEWLEYNISGQVQGCSEQHLYLGIYIYNNNDYFGYVNNPAPFDIEIVRGSFVEMRLSSESTSQVRADMIMIHEALNKITEIISDNQLTCKSNLYGRIDSIVNPNPTSYVPQAFSPFGAGALKAITNGYKIRNLYSDAETERNMPMSFKDIIESLDAIDCIGWGIVTEDGTMYVRVENWEWFYKNDVVLTITDPNEKTRQATQEGVITKITNGYRKYTTNEDYNTNENFHSERSFTSKVKALAKEASQLCKWIADTYSIEVTRRAKDDIDETEEFKYDENIFVFEIEADAEKSYQSITYRVAKDSITSASGITSMSELFNVRLSPRRMAERWKQRIALFNSSSPFVLTKGTVNYKAKINSKKGGDKGSYVRFYITNTDVSGTLAEDAAIAHVSPLIKSETLKIKYPISLAQYKAILANPYGLIVVDGEKCWLKEMQYEFKTGIAELTLIPKYEQ